MKRAITTSLIAAGLLALGPGEGGAQSQRENYPGLLCRSASPDATVVGSRIENRSTNRDILVSCPVVIVDGWPRTSAFVKVTDLNPVADIGCAVKSEYRYGGGYYPVQHYVFSTPTVTSQSTGIQTISLPPLYNAFHPHSVFIECTIPRVNGGTSGIDFYRVREDYLGWPSGWVPGYWPLP